MKESLDDVVISAVDQPAADTSADQMARQPTPEREKFDEGSVSATPSSIFVADGPSTATTQGSSVTWHSASGSGS